MWRSKLGLILIGVAITLFLVKVAIIPISFNIILSNLPGIYVSLQGWLAAPYKFIVFNILILVIAFSSSTFRAHDNNHSHIAKEDTSAQQEDDEEEEDEDDEVVDKEVVSMAFFKKPANPARVFVYSTDSKPCSMCSNEEKKDKQAPNMEEDKEDGLDETWKLIMEGKSKPPARQLRKSETWGSPLRGLDRAGGQATKLAEEESNDDPAAWAKKELRKSDTFNDSYSFRREKSISHDELNRQAEEFIKKFKLEMKLQRQESEQRFRELRSRGVYA